MKIFHGTANVSAKQAFYVQQVDLDTPRVVKWVIPSTGTIHLWGRMNSQDEWVDMVDSTATDQTVITLMPQLAVTLENYDSGTVKVWVDVQLECMGIQPVITG